MVNPTVDYRFGDRWTTADFVQVQNPSVSEMTTHLDNQKYKDGFIEEVAYHINVDYKYPLNILQQPAAEASLQKFSKLPLLKIIWQFGRSVDYHWQFPTEVIECKGGICIDTANLCTSILRSSSKFTKSAVVALGEVRQTNNDQLLGYHAWTKEEYKKKDWVIETTIHDGGTNMILAKDIYGSDFDIYYVEQAVYTEKGYEESKGGIPLVLLYRNPFLNKNIRRRYGFTDKKTYDAIITTFNKFNKTLFQMGKQYKRQRELKKLRAINNQFKKIGDGKNVKK